MADTPLQTKTYNTNTAATSHQITLDNPMAARSTLVIIVSYDGNTGAQVSSVTDSDSGTWNADASLKQSDGAGVNGEMLYRYNVAGFTTPTITVNLASSLKASITVAEYAGILSYASPLDRTVGRINTPASASQFRSSGNAASRRAPVEVIIGGMAWNSNTITTIINGSSWTTDAYTQNGTSNIGVAIGHRTTETASMSGATASASFRFSDTANTTPAAVVSGAFYREGVFPVGASSADGTISNIDGTVTVDDTYCWVFMSSSNAPTGGVSTSEKTDSYFMIDVTQYGSLPAGVTLSSPTFNWLTSEGFDEGTDTAARLYTDNNDINGATLDSGDEGRPTTNGHTLNASVVTQAIAQSVSLAASEINTAGRTSLRLTLETNELTGTYFSPHDYGALIPAYIRATLVRNHTLSPSDTVTMSDAVVKSPTLGKADTVTLTDAIVKSPGLNKADTITLSDALAKAVGISKGDTITLSDAVVKAVGLGKADSITMTDAITKTAGLAKSDSITMSDAIAKAVGLNKADTMTLSDLVSKSVGLSIADTITMSDIVTKAVGLVRSDQVSLSDAIAKSVVLYKQDVITLSDSSSEELERFTRTFGSIFG